MSEPQNWIGRLTDKWAIDVRATARHQLDLVANQSGLTALARNRVAGRGTILMFHEIQDDPKSELMTGISSSFFERVLTTVEQDGWEFLSLEDGLRRVADRGHPGQRFIILTFDDGYRDNLLRALPILERHSAPFTLFVPNGAVTRELYSWWLGLRRFLQSHDEMDIEAMGRRFDCGDFGSKIAALSAVGRWIGRDYPRAAVLKPMLEQAGISLDLINDQYFVSEEELRTIARHPLATIGAHTVTHPALSILDGTSARWEMSANRAFLENLLQMPIVHFAYPYGDDGACGPREGRLAKEVGFASAVTTRRGQLWPEHKHQVHALPRVEVRTDAVHSPFAWMFDVWVSNMRRMARGNAPAVTW
jgi:peptidoglycan/xylan/chitin deacetylase (PgdA/CDA1 family)